MSACRILIVEDELLVATDIEQSLQNAGHRVVGIADDYDGAVSDAEEAKPDLVLMDIALRGERSGIAAANVMREHWGIPVIFLTANADEATLTQARAAGPYGFLTKPFRSEELLEAVRIAIVQHERAEKLFASSRWLTTVLDSLSDGVIATDEHAVVRYLNPAAEKLTGWTPQTADGRMIEEVYPLADLNGRDLEQCLLRKALATGRYVGKARCLLKMRSGSRIIIEDSATPVVQDGRIIGAVTIFLEITKRLENERQQELVRDRLGEQAQAATEALGQTREELRALAANLMTTQERERSRIARELHDDLGQEAAILGLLIDRAGKDPNEMTAALQQLREHAQQLANGLRRVSHQLHPTMIADLGLTASLENLVEQEQQLGRDVHILAIPKVAPPLSLEASTALYRIAQEGLRNAAKYAPGASVNLSISSDKNELVLQLQDEGLGFSLLEARSRGGLGLISMQERARLVGGTFELNTQPGEGTLLIVRVPLSSGS